MIHPIPTAILFSIYLFYGLAFFSMGLAIILEGGRGSDIRLQLALRPLAAFGIIHGLHEWMDMYEQTGFLPTDDATLNLWSGAKLILLAFSFLSLAGFGFSAVAPNRKYRRIGLLAPLLLSFVWALGIFYLKGHFVLPVDIRHTADVWTRYSLGIPSALISAIGFVAQQRNFRIMGMEKFGRDSLIAAIALAWYGLVGQVFVRQSRFPPSTVVNEDLFLHWFHFPVQILRGALAIIIVVSVIRLMRSFDYEIKEKMKALRQARLREVEHREKLKGQLLQQVVNAQESERVRIARELHDDTGQNLTAIGLGLRGLSNSLQAKPKQSQSIIEDLLTLTANSLTELQRIISNLRPAQLDSLGLLPALRWFFGEASNQTGDLNIEFSVYGDVRPLSESVEVAIFRMAQEAITNVIKHGHAKTVKVLMVYEPHQVSLEVSDDGIGIELDKLESGELVSWGIHGMRERAALLGGSFRIESSPNHGVSISIRIPTQSTTPPRQTKGSNNGQEENQTSLSG